jgi:membrane protein DedA with SNARE-associated domain
VPADLTRLATDYGLLALFVVMLLKESGVPVPVPSDLLMLLAGAQAAAGAFGVPELAVAVLIAVFVGATVQFLAVRTVGRRLVESVGPRLGLDPSRVERGAERLRRRGALGVFLGLNVPGARAGVVVAAGLARLAYGPFAGAAVAGSAVFHGWHIALGYLAGPAAAALLGPGALVVLAVLAALGLIAWLLLRARARTTVRAWSEAACPACLLLTATRVGARGEPLI